MTTTSSENFFEKIWDFVKKIFGEALDEAKKIATVANAIVNEIKSLEANTTFVALQNIIIGIVEKEAPELKPLIDGFFLELPNILKGILNIIDDIDNDTLLQKLIEYLENAKGVSGTLFAGILGALSAVVQAFFANNTGVVNTDAQLLVTGQIVHAQGA